MSIPLPRCGDLRIVTEGPAIVLRPVTDGFAGPLTIPIALENISTRAIRAPLEIQVDSVTQVRGGRQIARLFSHNFYDIAVHSGRVLQQPWRLGPSTEPAPIERGATSALLPGHRTTRANIEIGIAHNARTLRLWIGFRGAEKQGLPGPPLELAPVRFPLDPAARSLIAATRFPKLRDSVGIFADSNRGLLIFRASFGEPQDCPSGCFYSNALGISYRGRAGWVSLEFNSNDSGAAGRANARVFEATADDEGLFSLFRAPADPRFAAVDPSMRRILTRKLLQSSFVPRALLRQEIDKVFSELDQPMVRLLVQLPTVRADAGLLTSLAFLPNGAFPYDQARALARGHLRELAPQLLQSPNTPAWTIFALAVSIDQFTDSVLAGAIAAHPQARRNPATMAVLADPYRYLRRRAVATVPASARVRAELEARFVRRGVPPVPGLRSGREMLLDPEIRGNPAALRLLANLTFGHERDFVFEAERLLPDADFLRWLPRYTPIPGIR